MHRTTAVRAVLAAALYALVLWGHVTLVEIAPFALLLLACATGAAILVGARPAPVRPGASGRGPSVPPDASDAGDIRTEREALRRLEAELHALEDQLRSASRRGDPGRPWGEAEPARG